MTEHRATIEWSRTTADFRYQSYTRDHVWRIPGIGDLAASAAPEFLGSAERINPEEALVAALSSCHMMSFLAVAAKRKHVVDRYVDEAVGELTKNESGKFWLSKCILKPRIEWGGDEPSEAELALLHRLAHEGCFIANSVRTEVVVEPA